MNIDNTYTDITDVNFNRPGNNKNFNRFLLLLVIGIIVYIIYKY